MALVKCTNLWIVASLLIPWMNQAQLVNSGSDGRDGDLVVTNGVQIDMADHPDGIFQYRSVQITPNGSIRFLPNKKNTPVIWLVQMDAQIEGTIHLDGGHGGQFDEPTGGVGGPSGFRGGGGGSAGGNGLGPGGGQFGPLARGGGYATPGQGSDGVFGGSYGNNFIFPVVGGSGGGGATNPISPIGGGGGGGGGGAILVAASGRITLAGVIAARGGNGGIVNFVAAEPAGAGSGGAVRLVASSVNGSGVIDCSPGGASGGLGRIRIDTPDDRFSGIASGDFNRGFQPIILPPGSSAAQLAISSIAGIPVSGNPSSSAFSPEVIIPAQVDSPVPVTVQCFNIPLNTSITLGANVASGQVIRGSALNSAGSLAQSSATILMNLPRGSGTLMAQTRIAVGAPQRAESTQAMGQSVSPFSHSGLTTDGERIVEVETEAILGGGSRQVYVTESGKRIPAPATK